MRRGVLVETDSKGRGGSCTIKPLLALRKAEGDHRGRGRVYIVAGRAKGHACCRHWNQELRHNSGLIPWVGCQTDLHRWLEYLPSQMIESVVFRPLLYFPDTSCVASEVEETGTVKECGGTFYACMAAMSIQSIDNGKHLNFLTLPDV